MAQKLKAKKRPSTLGTKPGRGRENVPPSELEILAERTNGRRRSIIANPTVLRSARGKIVGAINSLHDITEQRRMEADAVRLAAVVQSSHDAIVGKNLNGIITDWNEGARRIFGYAAKEVIGKSILILIPLDRQKEEQEILTRIRRGQFIDHYETVRRRKDGRLIDVSLTISPIRNRNGKIIGVSKIARDVTEQKRAERRFAEQARLLDLSNDAIIVRDQRNRITYWNRGAEKMYGYKRKEALGKVTHRLLKTKYLEPLSKILEKLHQERRWEGELVQTRRDGTELAIFSRWSLDRDVLGNPANILETNSDITKRKQAENALRQSEELYRALVSQTAVGMVQCNLKGEMEFVNGKFCEMLGYKPSELIGRTISEITHRDDLTATRKLFTELAREGRPYQLEKRYIRKNGSVLWVSVSASPMRDLNARTQSAIAVMVDITERKLAQEALEESKNLLEHRVLERTAELIAANEELHNEIALRKRLEGEIIGISDREQRRLGQDLHDSLCQNLAAIAFMARAVAGRLKDHRVIEVGDVEKIASLINEGVAEARTIARGLHPLEMDSAGLASALRALLHRQSRLPYHVDIDEEISIPDPATATHLFRIAREAVLNANKHARAREITLRMRRRRKHIELSVTDDGMGPPVKFVEGPGMGFHIMEYRARSIGAQFEVSPVKPHGTRVAVYLPAK